MKKREPIDENPSLGAVPYGELETMFPPTRLSLIADAGTSDEGARFAALEELCRIYWYPVYATARQCGCPAQDAADLTQTLFLRLIRADAFAAIQTARGRLRAYLRTSVKRLCQEEHRRKTAEKRIPEKLLDFIDAAEGEERYLREPPSTKVSPEAYFDRNWIQALLQEVENRLAEECTSEAMRTRFQALRPYIIDSSAEIGYGAMSNELGVSVGALKAYLSRLRRRFREAVRDEITQVVGSEDAVAEEMRELLAALADGAL